MNTLNKELIISKFDYLEDNQYGDIFSDLYSFEYGDSELFFKSKNKNVEQSQVDNFNWLVENQLKVRLEGEKFIADDIKKIGHKDLKKIVNGKFQIDIVTLLFSHEDFDIEIVCSVNYKMLFFKKRVDYVIAIKEKEIVEIIAT